MKLNMSLHRSMCLQTAWNETEIPFRDDACFQDLFEEQVSETPDSIALVYLNEALTYRQLNLRANKLAHYLIRGGLQPDDLVGLHVNRSLDMIIAMLAIWKAGGAYAPIDPAYPTTRMEHMLESANVTRVITQTAIAMQLPENLTKTERTVYIDTIFEHLSEFPDENPDRNIIGVTSRNLAYVLYTSGSTGKPKGVAIEHRSMINYQTNLASAFFLESLPGPYQALHVPSISFNHSIKPIVHLLHGGVLHILPEALRFNPSGFADYIKTRNIRYFDVTPSLLKSLIPYLIEECGNSQRIEITVGGESIDRMFWNTLAGLSNIRCLNSYGATECTSSVAMAEIKSSAQTPVAGRPLPNMQCYVLDSEMRPAPVGEPGELYVGGVGLARGYINRKDLTDQRFIKNPFSSDPNAKLYKTGDRFRYLDSGELEFLERIDNQVKIRGYRIELGEIENQLKECDGVADALVLISGDDSNEQYLTAYVIPRDGENSDLVKSLHRKLSKTLPYYMLPTSYYLIETFPLTLNGKVDKDSLLKVSLKKDGAKSGCLDPENDIEKFLVETCEKLFSIRGISIEDSFWRLGGTSLLAFLLIDLTKTHLGVELTIREIFTCENFRSLANEISSRSSASRIPS